MDSNNQYPELYYGVYPKVQDCINKYYPPYVPIYQMPDNEQMDTMVEEIYKECIEEYPEINQDSKERRIMARGISPQQRPFYGRRRIFRDLLSIIIIGELLRRRRYPYYDYRYRRGYDYGPGYY
ncbi:MAG: hypothetical protein FH753_11840 [Firmicutes bacterium]|nr:hypothetical protein [Bacillota bacterium]